MKFLKFVSLFLVAYSNVFNNYFVSLFVFFFFFFTLVTNHSFQYGFGFRILGLKICVSTNPTDPVFFCADPAIFIAFQKKKVKRFSYLPTLKCLRKLDKKTLKMLELQN